MGQRRFTAGCIRSIYIYGVFGRRLHKDTHLFTRRAYGAQDSPAGFWVVET